MCIYTNTCTHLVICAPFFSAHTDRQRRGTHSLPGTYRRHHRRKARAVSCMENTRVCVCMCARVWGGCDGRQAGYPVKEQPGWDPCPQTRGALGGGPVERGSTRGLVARRVASGRCTRYVEKFNNQYNFSSIIK